MTETRNLAEHDLAHSLKVSQEKYDAYRAWRDLQEAPLGALGGGFTWLISPNSIGTVVMVRNDRTKKEFDLTDYDSW